MTKKLIYLLIVVLLVAASLVFSGRRTNPPVDNTVEWSSSEARETFFQSCADCHSHETEWPWYSHVAPVSWRIIGHVNEGREHFNISSQDMGHADEAAEMVKEGEMPLNDYLWLHSEARMSEEERAQFASHLQATFNGGGEVEEE